MDVARVAETDFRRYHHRTGAKPRVCRVVLQPGRDHPCRERLGNRHMPVGRRPLGPANVDVTEDRVWLVWGIKEDLVPLLARRR